MTVRFGFDVLELRNFNGKSKTKQRERLMRCIIYVLIIPTSERMWLMSVTIYMHRRGAFGVARFDLPGNAKALTRGTSDRLAPRFLCHQHNLFDN